MGQVMAETFDDSSFLSKERKKGCTFFHYGVRICQKTFLFLHTIGYSRFKAVKASYISRGVQPRVHKNKFKHRESGLSVEDVKGLFYLLLIMLLSSQTQLIWVTHWVNIHTWRPFTDYNALTLHFSIDANAMLLPGRVPGYKNSDVKLLSSSTTKCGICWNQWRTLHSHNSGTSFFLTFWPWSPWATFAGFANRIALLLLVPLISQRKKSQL